MAKRRPAVRILPGVAEQYRKAAEERIGQLSRLYEIGFYGLAIYVAGVAAECIFRAYSAKRSSELDARHDLNDLAGAARFRDIVPPPQGERIRSRDDRADASVGKCTPLSL